MLETLGLQELSNIAYMACQEELSTIIDKSKSLFKGLPDILE